MLLLGFLYLLITISDKMSNMFFRIYSLLFYKMAAVPFIYFKSIGILRNHFLVFAVEIGLNEFGVILRNYSFFVRQRVFGDVEGLPIQR